MLKWCLSLYKLKFHFSFVEISTKMKKEGRLINLNMIKCKLGKKMVHNSFKDIRLEELTCFFQKI